MAVQTADMQREEAEFVATMKRGRERFFLEAGGIQRAGIHDARCPSCNLAVGETFLRRDNEGQVLDALPWLVTKRHCPGRDPLGMEKNPSCYVLGGHNHARCPSCGFGWLEREKRDEHEVEGRGNILPGEFYDQETRRYVNEPDGGQTLFELYGYVAPPTEEGSHGK